MAPHRPNHPPGLAQHLYYADAGHYYFGLPPYYPYFNDAALGGIQQANARAVEQFWTRMIAFLNQLQAS